MSIIQTKRNFVKFLNNMKSIKESSFTHTSIMDPPGSFYIQSEDMDTFFKLYKTALKNDCDLFLTEKHRDIAPILLDFDLRFNTDHNTRKYTIEHIKQIILSYIEELDQYVNITENIEIYVTEKTAPVLVEDKNYVKDGIHIVIANVVTRKSVQLLIRKNLLKTFEKILSDIPFTNTIEDVYDECVISKNNWQMYGSKKPNSEAYKVTHHFSYNIDGKDLETNDLLEDDTEYVEILSIRNKYVESKLKDTHKDEIKVLDKQLREHDMKKEKKKEIYNKIISTKESNFAPSSEELGLVEKLIDILNIKRSENYGDWIRLGWCLRNIDMSLLDKWDEFSKNSKKYKEGHCETLWYYMKEGGLGIGTLHMWAKDDNLEEYRKIVTADLSSFIKKSLSMTDYDIAMVISRKFKHRFRCASNKHHTWYEFKDHRWREIEKGYTLFYKEIPTELFNEYQNSIQRESQRAQMSTDDDEKDKCQQNIDKLNKIAGKLKNTSFREKMYKECSGIFYEPGFTEKLDSNPSLLGFENGVYDLETDEFRQGRPEDYVSLSTGINYIEYDQDNPYISQVMNFMEKVLTNENVRKYVMTLFASILDGKNRDEKFHMWTGSGSNGKSKIVELFQYAIGDYACIFNVSLLTQKRVGSSATNSELAIAKGKRFAILQEPEENERLNVGIMKELTGGDTIQCRPLYKEPIKFKPMFKMILTCNHMPAIPPDDGGTWRRVRRVEFASKFVDNPVHSNEFKIDRELTYKFEVWKETFMIMLLECYKEYKTIGKIIEPKEVLDATNEYQRKNDIFADFCETYIEYDAGDIADVNELFDKFKEYCSTDNIKSIKKPVFTEAMEKRYGKAIQQQKRGVKCFKGIRIINSKRIDNEETD